MNSSPLGKIQARLLGRSRNSAVAKALGGQSGDEDDNTEKRLLPPESLAEYCERLAQVGTAGEGCQQAVCPRVLCR